MDPHQNRTSLPTNQKAVVPPSLEQPALRELKTILPVRLTGQLLNKLIVLANRRRLAALRVEVLAVLQAVVPVAVQAIAAAATDCQCVHVAQATANRQRRRPITPPKQLTHQCVKSPNNLKDN